MMILMGLLVAEDKTLVALAPPVGKQVLRDGIEQDHRLKVEVLGPVSL